MPRSIAASLWEVNHVGTSDVEQVRVLDGAHERRTRRPRCGASAFLAVHGWVPGHAGSPGFLSSPPCTTARVVLGFAPVSNALDTAVCNRE